MRIALVVGLVVVVLVGLLTACGGSGRLSAKDYRAELAALDKRQDKAHADLEKLRKAKSGSEIRDGLIGYANQEEQFAGEVEKLKPPKDAEKPNALLVRGALNLSSELREIVSELPESENPQAASKRLEAVGGLRGAAEKDRALSQLKKLGYAKES